MLGEKAERRKAAPISSAMEWKRLLKISSSAGSSLRIIRLMCAPLQDQIAFTIHPAAKVRRHHRGGAVLRHDSRSVERVSRRKLRPVIEGSVHHAGFKPNLLSIHNRPRRGLSRSRLGLRSSTG